jgi:hypothetical protein
MAKPKRTRSKKQNSIKKKKRGGGNCGSICTTQTEENPWLTVDRESSGRKIHRVPRVPNDKEDTTDWNALIDAAKVANENNKRREEETANLKIAEYKAANPSHTERAIRRTFRIGNTGGRTLRGVHRIKLSL